MMSLQQFRKIPTCPLHIQLTHTGLYSQPVGPNTRLVPLPRDSIFGVWELVLWSLNVSTVPSAQWLGFECLAFLVIVDRDCCCSVAVSLQSCMASPSVLSASGVPCACLSGRSAFRTLSGLTLPLLSSLIGQAHALQTAAFIKRSQELLDGFFCCILCASCLIVSNLLKTSWMHFLLRKLFSTSPGFLPSANDNQASLPNLGLGVHSLLDTFLLGKDCGRNTSLSCDQLFSQRDGWQCLETVLIFTTGHGAATDT